ncbi:hypothetical protein [Nostoc sp. PA-18-2419]|nr:hypothetical protein [Nostoc sp. PA-18-2419]
MSFIFFDTQHFALEEDGDAIADYIRRFLTTNVVENTKLTTNNK